MKKDKPPEGEPLGRAPEAALQIKRAARYVARACGRPNLSIIAHSWGSIAAGRFGAQHPEFVDRMVFFAPIVQRARPPADARLGPWRLVTVAEQHKRFVEDVPAGHAPVLLDRHFVPWAVRYLASDPTSGTRTPPSVKTPNGPIADILAAWSGSLAYDPGAITAPLALVRGEWDSLCDDRDAAWLMRALCASPQTRDVKLEEGTHLMHLEENRGDLYRAAAAFLSEGA